MRLRIGISHQCFLMKSSWRTCCAHRLRLELRPPTHLLGMLCLVLFANCAPVAGQSDACLDRTISITLLTPAGVTVAANDLQAVASKRPVKINSVAPDIAPHRILILFDTSASVLTPAGSWPAYLSIAANLVANLPPGDAVGIAVFADGLQMLVPFTDERQTLQERLTKLKAGRAALPNIGRATALYDSLVQATDLFTPKREGDLLFVLTDSDDDSSRLRGEDAGKIIQSSGIRLDSISIANSPVRGEREQQSKFQALVAKTGGTGVVISGDELQGDGKLVDKAGNPTKRGAVWLELFRMLPRLAQVRIELSEKQDKDSYLEVRGPTPREIQVDYRVNLQPCTTMDNAGGSSH